MIPSRYQYIFVLLREEIEKPNSIQHYEWVQMKQDVEAMLKQGHMQDVHVLMQEFYEGYTFSGWSEIPETMPAHDVTITGTFTLNTAINQIIIDKNGNTMIFMIDGKRVNKLQKNLNIIRMKDGTTRKVIKK